MRLEKGSKRCTCVVAVSLVAFFAFLEERDDVPGEEAAMVIVVTAFGSKTLAS
jgi:hypothetical protein